MIRIELNDREVRQALERLARRVNNLTPAMHDVGQALMEGSRQRISEGRDWQGRPFAPNSPFTLARKRGNKPLIDTGNLVGSRLHYRAGRDFVEVGSSAVQAAVLQFGAKRGQFGKSKRGALLPWGDPPRPFLPIEGADKLPVSTHSRLFGREKPRTSISACWGLMSFNPLPAFRPGETQRREQTARRQYVSTHSRLFGREKPARCELQSPPVWFQPTPGFSAGRNQRAAP